MDYLEYLESPSAATANWIETDWCLTRKAFKFQDVGKSSRSAYDQPNQFKIKIEEESLPYFENIVFNHGGFMRATLSCKVAKLKKNSSDSGSKKSKKTSDKSKDKSKKSKKSRERRFLGSSDSKSGSSDSKEGKHRRREDSLLQ